MSELIQNPIGPGQSAILFMQFICLLIFSALLQVTFTSNFDEIFAFDNSKELSEPSLDFGLLSCPGDENLSIDFLSNCLENYFLFSSLLPEASSTIQTEDSKSILKLFNMDPDDYLLDFQNWDLDERFEEDLSCLSIVQQEKTDTKSYESEIKSENDQVSLEHANEALKDEIQDSFIKQGNFDEFSFSKFYIKNWPDEVDMVFGRYWTQHQVFLAENNLKNCRFAPKTDLLDNIIKKRDKMATFICRNQSF